jgi:hypothetical protein
LNCCPRSESRTWAISNAPLFHPLGVTSIFWGESSIFAKSADGFRGLYRFKNVYARHMTNIFYAIRVYNCSRNSVWFDDLTKCNFLIVLPFSVLFSTDA